MQLELNPKRCIHDYLKDPVASNFDEWFLSKKYKRKALDEELIKTKKTSGISNHETAAAAFFLRIIAWIRANY